MNWLIHLDRRWIFLAMGLAVAVPLLFQVTFPEIPSPMVVSVFDAIDELPEGSRVLMAFDFDPASAGELQPMAAAFTRHAALKGHKLYFVTLWPLGVPMVQSSMGILREEFPDYQYGRDYVNLGFQPGNEIAIRMLTADLRRQTATDARGTSLSSLPLTRDVRSIQQMDLIISVSAGDPGAKQWVQYAATPFNILAVAGSTGVQTPGLYPYIPRQLRGVLGAIKAAAEYEQVVIDKYPRLAENRRAKEGLRRMGPQLVAHLLVIGLIVLGNVIFFTQKRRGMF